VAVDRTPVDGATVSPVPSEQLSCATCGAPTAVVEHHEPPLRIPVPRIVCTSLICPTNLEGLDDVDELDFMPRVAG
jgi:hypothetical protein